MAMTCGFCGKPAIDCFTGLADGGQGAALICYDCVRDLYIAMISAEMLPRRRFREPLHPAPRPANLIRMQPRKQPG
jgi:hypothetical protein